MGREVKRVPLDFKHEGPWPGYLYHEHCQCGYFLPDPEYYDKCLVDLEDCPHYYDPPTGEGWQLWENVSEGSPVTPVFATKGELIDYLVKHGAGGAFETISRASAEAMCSSGWFPSGCIIGGQYMHGADGLVAMDKDEK